MGTKVTACILAIFYYYFEFKKFHFSVFIMATKSSKTNIMQHKEILVTISMFSEWSILSMNKSYS